MAITIISVYILFTIPMAFLTKGLLVMLCNQIIPMNVTYSLYRCPFFLFILLVFFSSMIQCFHFEFCCMIFMFSNLGSFLSVLMSVAV